MTDRERMASAYGLLWGAANGTEYIKRGGVKHLLIPKSAVVTVLEILHPATERTEDSP